MSAYLDKSGLGYVWNKIKALIPTYSKQTFGILYGTVDGTSTSTSFTATVPGLTEYKDGVAVMLKNGVVTSASGFKININGLGAKPVYNNMAAATAETTLFNINYTFLFVYDSTRVTGGCWVLYRGYDSNTNTIGYQLRTNSTVLKVSDKTRYYRMLFTSADGTHWVPANTGTDNSATSVKTVNQRKIDPFGRIVYLANNTSYAAEADIAAGSIWDQYTFALGFSFNRTGSALTLTTKAPVYVKCAPQSDGSAIIDSTAPIVQALPSTEDGKIYIFLGIAYSATNIETITNHPVYYYKDSSIRLWTNQVAGGGSSVSPYASNPAMDGTASPGSSDDYARGDHVHPSDTSKADTVHTHTVSQITDFPSLATVATSGNYTDLSNKPSLATVATSGNYSDLNGAPVLATVATSGDYTDLSNTPSLAAVATSGNYSDLSGTPTLATVATSGNYTDLSNTPSLATVATTGNYTDLSNKPTIPTAVSQLSNDSNFITGMTILSYGSSNWTDFINAYNSKTVVYCRASSNANPGQGAQTRLAFLAYINADPPTTEVEFQYYRSVSSHSDTQQGDQVFVYKLHKTNGWSVTTREAYSKMVPSTGLTKSYSSGTLTFSVTNPLPAVTSSDNGKFLVVDNGSWTAQTIPNANGNSF